MFSDHSKKSSAYYQVRDWLEGFIPQVYGKEELGLARIEYLLRLLGNPQNKFKSIHVAGTSGKGSTAYYIAKLLEFSRGPVSSFPPVSAQSSWPSQPSKSSEPEALRAVGSLSSVATPCLDSSLSTGHSALKIGLHISPHLVDIRERMQVFSTPRHSEAKPKNLRSFANAQDDNKAVGEESLMPLGRFLKLFSEIKPMVEKIQKEKPDLTPSYFEILVAASFLYFAQEKVDFAVVEVGLGGRLDATNVLEPEVSVITNVGLDHTDILGKTVDEIAFEKAGIIKEGVPVITSSGRALKVIEKVAKEKKAPLIILDTQRGEILTKSDAFSNIARSFYLFRYHPIANQPENLKLAVAAVLALGFGLSQEIIDKVQEQIFPGRFEEIEPGVVLDGAHNADKIRALIDFVKNSKFQTTNPKNILRAKREATAKNILVSKVSSLRQVTDRTVTGVTLVLAFKKGKNWKKMIDLLLKNLPVERVIATEFQAVTDTGRLAAVPAEEIARYVESKWKVKVESIENSQEAVFRSLNARRYLTNSLILVTGSLYLVGEARTMWQLPEI